MGRLYHSSDVHSRVKRNNPYFLNDASNVAPLPVHRAGSDRSQFDRANTSVSTPPDSGLYRFVSYRARHNSPDKPLKRRAENRAGPTCHANKILILVRRTPPACRIFITCSTTTDRTFVARRPADANRSFPVEGANPRLIMIEGWIMRRVVAALRALLASTAASAARARCSTGLISMQLEQPQAPRARDRLHREPRLWLGGSIRPSWEDRATSTSTCRRPMTHWSPRSSGNHPPWCRTSTSTPFWTLAFWKSLDRMISQGATPATIIAAPDGTYEGTNRIPCSRFTLGQRPGRSIQKRTSLPRFCPT